MSKVANMKPLLYRSPHQKTPFVFLNGYFGRKSSTNFKNILPRKARLRGGNPHSKLYGYIECEAIMAAHMFMVSLPRQKNKEAKREKVRECYTYLNELYNGIQKSISNQKSLRSFGIIHSILEDKYDYLGTPILMFPKIDIEYRHVFQDDFLNRAMSLKLYDKQDEGYTLFEQDEAQTMSTDDFRNILLGLEFKIKRKPIMVQWSEKAFFFLLFKFEDQHARINYQRLPKIVKYKENNKNFSYTYFRQFRKRLKEKLDDPTGNRFQKYLSKNASLYNINKSFDNYINYVDCNMMNSGLKRS